MVDSQKWLYSQPEYNSKEKRKYVEELEINDENLEGELDLNDFTSLKILRCNNNELTKLDVSNCKEIIEVYCQKNKLKKLLLPNDSKITRLNINNNLLTDKTIFQKLSNELIYVDICDNMFGDEDSSFFKKRFITYRAVIYIFISRLLTYYQ